MNFFFLLECIDPSPDSAFPNLLLVLLHGYVRILDNLIMNFFGFNFLFQLVFQPSLSGLGIPPDVFHGGNTLVSSLIKQPRRLLVDIGNVQVLALGQVLLVLVAQDVGLASEPMLSLKSQAPIFQWFFCLKAFYSVIG